MTPRLNVLIASYLEPELVEEIRRRVPEVEVIFRPDLLYTPRFHADHTTLPSRTPEQDKEWVSLLGKADVLFDFGVTHVQELPEIAPHVKWIQATSAGIGQFIKRMGYADRTKWIFTTASGIHGRPLAEFVIMSMLVFVKDLFLIQEQQASRKWQQYSGKELSDHTLGIIGLGKIGREIARRAKSFDMHVVGDRRDPKEPIPFVDEVYGPEDLSMVLKQSNFLCISVPHTMETDGLIGEKELAMLPKGAVLINISRGAVVDEAALIKSLQTGHLGGASLDVFAQEPLPAASPLWSMPRVIVSPHSASTNANENKRLTELFIENLQHYLKGEPLRNVLDVNKLY
jgi:glyoxylate/hydroxypyruvate reductase A